MSDIIMPCIKHKCILLPVCKCKEHIMCNMLSKTLCLLEKNNQSNDIVKEVLPKLIVVMTNDGNPWWTLSIGGIGWGGRVRKKRLGIDI